MKGLIAEFEEQSFTQIIFPHVETDWCKYIDEARENFVNIINAIIRYQKCLVVCDNIESVKKYFNEDENLFFVEYKTDDTWARDCSAIGIVENGVTKLLDFTFNAWGDKFEATKDNLMSRTISNSYSQSVQTIDFVLEGGAIESNGAGLILTTSTCMNNRNLEITSQAKENKLKEYLGAKEILMLNHGYLAGDDTDSHVDTLARFIDEKTIMYLTCAVSDSEEVLLGCKDKDDEHYTELKLMQEELHLMAKKYDLKLIELPMTDAIYFEGERLPATYANFLFINGAILVPTYGVKQDKEALEIFKSTFNDRDIIPIDCQTLIKQHGSLHCVTMNFASGITLK